MFTSHVGSFPLEYSYDNVVRILRDVALIGIDVPPYPQLRSFIEMYIDPLRREGVVRTIEGVDIVDLSKLEIVDKVKVDVREAEVAADVVKRMNLGFKGLRAPITGPFTLSSQLYVDPKHGRTVENSLLVNKRSLDLVPYIEKAVEYMKNLGYTHIFLDEPILGVIVGKRRIAYGYRGEDIVETLSRVGKVVKPCIFGIHVCGRISDRLVEVLCQVPELKYLNFEFMSSPQNIESVSREVLEKCDKILAPGIVNTRSLSIESLDQVVNLLRKIVERIGVERVDLVSGDCGFGALREQSDPEKGYAVALEKLKLVVKAVRILEGRT